MTDFSLARVNMVESQVRPNGITDRRIIDAMATIAREDFLPPRKRQLAYVDDDIEIAPAAAGFAPRVMIEPMALARLIHLATVRPTDRVLHIGAATGYGTAVLARLAANVVALESDGRLIDGLRAAAASFPHVQVVDGPLAEGYSAGGPYDIIFIEGRIAEVPAGLFSQVSEGGRVVAVLGESEMAKACLWTLAGNTPTRRAAFDASVGALPGFARRRPDFLF